MLCIIKKCFALSTLFDALHYETVFCTVDTFLTLCIIKQCFALSTLFDALHYQTVFCTESDLGTGITRKTGAFSTHWLRCLLNGREWYFSREFGERAAIGGLCGGACLGKRTMGM
jgi:hypothetical protein